MIRKPEELIVSIREAVDHRAVLYSNLLFAVVVAVHTALDPHSLGYQIVLAFIISGFLVLMLLLRVFDLTTVNKRPLIYIIFYQIFVFLGIGLISDAATPYTVGLFLVVLVSNLYYGAKGVWVTVACFAFTTIVKYFYLSATVHIDLSGKLNIIVAFFVFTAVCSVFVNYQKVFDWDRARLKETEVKLVNSINSLEFGFVITDNTPEVTTINDTSHEILCGSKDHTPAKCPLIKMEFLGAQFGAKNLLADVKKSMENKKPHTIKELEFKGRNWQIFITPMLDEETISGATIIIQDVTDEYMLNRSRDEFFSIASHELRTPLTAIRGNSSMMLDFYAEKIKDPDLHEMVEDIHDSSERLVSIVSDFLDVSKLESGHVAYKFETLALKPVIEKVLHELTITAKEKDITLKLGTGFKNEHSLPEILADKDRVTQIVYNLLSNASKFTSNGTITIDAKPDEKDMIKISISDTGSGIEPKMQALLFRKFQQAGNSILVRDSQGTGLGLYISKLLAEGMGGTVRLEHSEPGKGSTFSFTLPVATQARIDHATKIVLTETSSVSGLNVPVTA
jgi:signal transduction histidine kinase